MASKNPRVAVFIGADSAFADAVGASFDVTVTASRSAYLGAKYGTPEEWRAHCIAAFEASAAEESPVIADAVQNIMTHKANVTVFCDALAFGVKDAAGKSEVFASIASPDAWKNVGSLARSMGATVIFL